MDPERWLRIENLYHAALEYEPDARGKFLAQACEGDAELRTELESLLSHAKTGDAFLEKPAVECASALLVKDDPQQDTEHARRTPRPPWWIYVIAFAFVARAVFITYFCLFGLNRWAST